MCRALLAPSTNAEITLPSAVKERLILMPSFIRVPVAPVLAGRSDPARSTRLSFPRVMCSFPSADFIADISIMTVKMEWLRDEVSFIKVAPVVLCLLPSFITLSIACPESTTT